MLYLLRAHTRKQLHCLIVGAHASLWWTAVPRSVPFLTHHVCRIRHIMGFYLSALPKLPHEQKPHVQIFTPVDHSNRVAVTGLILFNCLHKEYRDVCAAWILTLTVGSFTTDDFFVSCVILNGTKRFDSLSPPPSVTTVEVSRAKEDGEKMVIFFSFYFC